MAGAGVLATINYHLPKNKGGLGEQYNAGTLGSIRAKRDSRQKWIEDIRDQEDKFDIDTCGFALYHHESNVISIAENDDEVRRQYYPEMQEFLLETLRFCGVTRVCVMGHYNRCHSMRDVYAIPGSVSDDAPVTQQYPAMFAHVDLSYRGAEALWPSPAKNRWSIINVWRPLKTVTREPLAVCDGRTVLDSHLKEVTITLDGHKESETPMLTKIWEVRADEAHRWYWPSEMRPDEVLLFKCFDSRKDGVARRTPHTAFFHPSDNGPARESIELRALCIFEGQEVDGECARQHVSVPEH